MNAIQQQGLVIIGNSGSGKTWLARHLSVRSSKHVIHLDDIFWLPGGFDRKRADAEVEQLIARQLMQSDWIVEGIYGKLAAKFLDHASTLIWLDMPLELCLSRLEQRGSESKTHLSRPQSEAGLQALLAWASAYPERTGSSGRQAHEELFKSFAGTAWRLSSATELEHYLASPN